MSTEEKAIRLKFVLLESVKQLGNVAQAFSVIGLWWDSLCCFIECNEQVGLLPLQEISKNKPIFKFLITGEIQNTFGVMVTDSLAYGQLRISNELMKLGTFISLPGQQSDWLFHYGKTYNKWMMVLEVKFALNGFVFGETQFLTLECAKKGKQFPLKL